MKNVQAERASPSLPAVAMAGRKSPAIVQGQQGAVAVDKVELAKLDEPEVAEGEIDADSSLGAPLLSVALKPATTPVFNKLPLLAQDKFSTPPPGKAGTPPLPRPIPVLTERNRELGGRRPNALQVPPKNFLRHQERYMSPTDSMVSPISKGLLLRTRRPVRTTAPLAPLKDRIRKRKRDDGSES
eukprot:TRINITY_DN5764_c0_g1_i1.p1 TRINITY_DN5764_c0_g1~~TRINITY_DN5764_c0_g1_i1.p1  ORF type:complete len:185 (-),score=29.83 TRINITY_DN5764_c0_g1_i1:827-1381(-)